jgi:hypothetical protein
VATPEQPPRTVGQLIERLERFGPDEPVKVQGALAKEAEWILAVSHSPEDPETVVVVYVESVKPPKAFSI